jgi:23S rRNA (cytosine1962-C5)-methyltransferase
VKGQKTGFFLDQRENRSRVAEISGGKDVLNVFAYTGGFSVAAALGGATRVTTVDIAAPAVETAERTFRLNGLDPAKHAFQAADAFDVLADLSSRGAAGQHGPHNLIVLDPPSFVRNRASRERGIRAYWKLNEMALRALPPGGWLCTASCSSHISDADFLEIVRHAVSETGRSAHIAGLFGAGPDHPTRPGFAEGRYLQFVMLRVV